MTLQRRVAIARYTDFQPSGQFYADTLNDELDRLVAMVQQVDRDASRALRLDVEEPDVALLLPEKSRRAGQVIAFDAQGNVTTVAAELGAQPGWPNLDAVPEGTLNKHFTAPEKAKLAALAPHPPVITMSEKQDGSETALRSFSPRDVADMARMHASLGGVTSAFGRYGAIAAAAGDYRADQITDTANKVIMTAAERGKLARMRSVLDSGAVGDGVTDDTGAIAAMPASGGRRYFPAGVYKISTTVTLSKPEVYYGDGQATVIRTGFASGNAFSVGTEQVIITDMSWDSEVARAGGAYVGVRPSANRFRLQRFVMRGAFIGIQVEPGFGATATIAEGQILGGVPSTSVAVLLEGGFDLSVNDLLVGSGPLINAGVRVTNTGDLTLDGLQLLRCGIGLDVSATAGHAVAPVWANNSFFDNCGTGVDFYSNGGSIVRCIFDQCWFSSATFGCRLRTAPGGQIDGVEFNGCHVFLSTGDGITIADTRVKNVSVRGGAFAQNGSAAFGLARGVGEFSIIGARMGATHGLTGNRYGIFIPSGTSNNYIVAFNDLRGNTTGALADGGTGAKIVTGNLGV